MLSTITRIVSCSKDWPPRREHTARVRIVVAMALDLLKELEGCKGLLLAQVSAGLGEDEVLEAMYTSWVERLAALGEASADAKQALTTAVAQGPWSSEQKKMLARTIMNSRLITGKAVPKERRAMQTCPRFENMLTEAVWVCVRNAEKYTQTSRISMMATVAWLVGIECPTEPLLYRMVAILAYGEQNFDMSQSDVFDCMEKFKSFIKARIGNKPRPSGFPFIKDYPLSARELPAAVLDFAYSDGVIPVDVDISELDSILGQNKMRGRKGEAAWMQNVPEQYRGIFMQASSAGGRVQRTRTPLQLGGPNQTLALGDASMYRQTRSPQPLRALLPGHGSPSHSEDGMQLALLGASPRDDHDIDRRVDDHRSDRRSEEATAGSLDEMERSMMEAITKATAKKKAKKDAEALGEAEDVDEEAEYEEPDGVAIPPKKKPSVKSSSLKKPAHAKASSLKKPASSVMKRPAAAAGVIDMRDVFVKLRADVSTLSRNAFTSRAYDTARRRMVAAGHDDRTAIEFARTQLARASSLHSELAK